MKYDPAQQYPELSDLTERTLLLMLPGEGQGSSRSDAWFDVLMEAFDYYCGFGDVLQDSVAARRLFKRAAELGAVEPYQYLGNLYMHGQGCTRSKEKAIEYYKEGASRGDANCYAALGIIFAEMGHKENSRKCWKEYFAAEVDEDPSAIGTGEYGWCYFKLAGAKKIPLENIDALRQLTIPILRRAEREIQKAEQKGERPRGPGLTQLKIDFENAVTE